MPGKKVALAVDFAPPVAPDLQEGWTRVLAERLAEEGLETVAAGTPGSVPVHVAAALVAEPGQTDTGAAFHAARGRATIRALRARVDVESRPAVAPDSRRALAAASYDLLRRVAAAIAD